MNTFTRGLRNAFRNTTRTVSIVIILGISTGLALAMLIAHQAVNTKINSVKSSVGNTITITPAGFSSFSQVNNALTSSQLLPISSFAHITSISETLTDRLTTIGSSTPSFGQFSNQTSSNNQTNLTSPVTINFNRRVFFSGGAASSSLPTNFSPPITIIGTNTPGYINGQNLTLLSGQFINGNTTQDQAIISSSMASKNNLKTGSTFTAYGSTITVKGIFNDNSNKALSNDVIVSLTTEQSLSNQSGTITSALVTVDSLDNLSSLTNKIQQKLGTSNATVTSSVDQANNTLTPLNSVKSISLYSLIGATIAGGIIILLTMVMVARERRREIGVLKAIGASNTKIVSQFAVEAVTLTLIGAVIGILIGILGANPITKLLVSSSTSSTTNSIQGVTISGPGFSGGGPRFTTGGRGAFGFVSRNFTNVHAVVGWNILLYGLGVAVLVSIVGSTVVAFLISKIKPIEVMRAE